MSRALSLRDFYDRAGAFADRDPMVRIAALHHAGASLADNPGMRELVAARLEDADERVARYAAVALAQAGDEQGVRHLLEQLARSDASTQRPLEACLRDCARFPFAVLLSRLLALGGGLNRKRAEACWLHLEDLLLLPEEEFCERSRADPRYADGVVRRLTGLDRVKGLAPRANVGCALSRIDALPRPDRPGRCRMPGLLAGVGFEQGAVLNPDRALEGQKVLLVGPVRPSARQESYYHPLRVGRRGGRRGVGLLVGDLREEEEEQPAHVLREVDLLYVLPD
jgi:hypothetical protein